MQTLYLHVLERAGLGAIAIDCDWAVLHCLDNEVADHAPVVRVHARPERVEDPRHTHIHAALRVAPGHHAMRLATCTLALNRWEEGGGYGNMDSSAQQTGDTSRQDTRQYKPLEAESRVVLPIKMTT
jgi:hypothetical protein